MLVEFIPQHAIYAAIVEVVASVIDVVDVGAQRHPQLVVLGERCEIGGVDGLGEAAPVGSILAECGENREIYRKIQSLVQSPAVAISVPAISVSISVSKSIISKSIPESPAIGKVGNRIIIIIAILRILQGIVQSINLVI